MFKCSMDKFLLLNYSFTYLAIFNWYIILVDFIIEINLITFGQGSLIGIYF